MPKVKHSKATAGAWIKDKWRKDRSLGIVLQVDEQTNMMFVHFPKIANSSWLVWENSGHYKVINS